MLLGEVCESLKFLPPMHYRIDVYLLDTFQDSVAEFLPRVDTNLSQESTRHFAEMRLRKVEPRSVGGSEDILETVRLGCQVVRSFF